MSADIVAFPETPTTPEGLAWHLYRRHDPTVERRLANLVGADEAAALMLRARALLERWCPRTRNAGPTTHADVWTADGVDHHPIREMGATFCAICLPPGYATNPPQGTPCADCFGAQS